MGYAAIYSLLLRAVGTLHEVYVACFQHADSICHSPPHTTSCAGLIGYRAFGTTLYLSNQKNEKLKEANKKMMDYINQLIQEIYVHLHFEKNKGE